MKTKIIALVVVLLGVAALWWQQMQVEPLRVSGALEADEVRVGSRVGGRVQEVLVEEGQPVKNDDLLVRLEPFDLLEQLADAQATAAAAGAELEKFAAGFRPQKVARAAALREQADAEYREAQAGPRRQEIQEARDQLALAEADLELDELNYARREELFARKTITREEFDRAVAERKAARARTAAAKSRLDLLLEGTRPEQVDQAKARLAAAESEAQLYRLGYRQEEVDRARAQANASQARVKIIQQQLAELEVRSPCDGVIEAMELRPGDLVPASAPVLSVMDTRRMWVRAYVPQSHLTLVPLEKRLRINVDSSPEQIYWGRVIYVSRQAEFTPDNVQTPEERSKQVFRIKVEIEGDLSHLRPGMTADVMLEENGDAP
jgi:multidrug resistance efflux pump